MRAGTFAGVTAVALSVVGCMQWSPFEVDVDPGDRDLNAMNLSRLERGGAPADGFRFAVISDTHGDYDQLAEVVDALNQRTDVSFLVHLGDVSDDGLLVEYENTLALLRRLTIPFFVVLGNHDTYSNGREIYRRMFGPYDFVIPYGDVRVVCFNSISGVFDGVPDYGWVEGRLAAMAPTDRVVLASHSALAPDAVVRDDRVKVVTFGHLHTAAFDVRGGVLVLEAPAIEDFTYDVVDVTPGSVAIERCVLHSCERLKSP